MRKACRSLSAVLLAMALVASGVAIPVPYAAAAAAPLKVAVVTSAITEGAYKADGSQNGSHARRARSVYDLLAQEPGLSVTMIGDTELGNVATLRNYDVVVLVRNVATIESQRLALRQYAAEGGGVVSMFSTSRYDYRAGQSSPYGGPGYSSYHTPYFQFNFAWGFSGSSFMSQSFEYGELSELIGTKFCNDPLFQPNYQLVSSGAAHPILQMTAAEVGTSKISFSDPNAQYNETVWPTKNAPITTLLNYGGERVGGSKVGIENAPTRYGAASHMAAWAMPYYYGKVVSYGFQIYDLIGQRPAARLVVNSVKWAGTHDGFGNITKAPDVSVNAWYTRGQIWATAGVSNAGSIQLRGRLRVDYYRPGASTPFTGCWIKDPQGYIPVPPGESYKDTASANPSVSASSGRWKVRATYTYYDYFRGGWVSVYRDGYLDGTGSGMTWRGTSGLARPTSVHPWPSGSAEISGSDRYGTSAAISKNGWPNGVEATSGAVILASGLNYADALAAAPLAGKLNAPILLTNPAALPASVAGELSRLYASQSAQGPAKLYVVSSLAPGVLSAAQAAIQNAGSGGRSVETSILAGTDCYDTARGIACALKSPTGGGPDTAFIVTGNNFADAMSIAPVAARMQAPILFVDGSLPAVTRQALDDLGISKSIIIGSTTAVSPGVQTALEGSGHRARTDPRLSGATRYDTCLKVMEYAKSTAGFSDVSLFVATGAAYPDALAAAPLAAMRQTPVLLVDGSTMAYSPAAGAYLLGRRAAKPKVTFLGGTPAVGSYVRGQIGSALTP
jgi:putative cell wall-binding protein